MSARQIARTPSTPLTAAVGMALAVGLIVPVPGGSRTALVSLTGSSLSTSSLGALESAVHDAGGEVVRSFSIAGAALVRLPANMVLPQNLIEIPDVALGFTSTTGPDDVPGHTYRDTISAPDNAGDGVVVALVDTGVADVPGVTVSKRINVSDGASGDGYGHGTFMAGLIAGNGEYPGVAPKASILDVQVAEQDGSTSLAKVLAGIQAVADEAAADPRVKVLNLSLGSGSPLPPAIDPLTRALDRLWARGVTVVVPSGNDGKGTVSSPGVDPVLLTVGATDENRTSGTADDSVAEFSGYGMSYGMKPDIVAPGVSLISLRAPGSIADVQNPNSRLGDSYFHGTGTSMSTAVTSGAVAALVGARGFSPDQVKAALMQTADSRTSLGAGAGAGQINVADALAATPKMPKDDPNAGPKPSDAATWQVFVKAWSDGNQSAARAAWNRLSPQTRRWAASFWSLEALSRAIATGDFSTVEKLGRSWRGSSWTGNAEDTSSAFWAGRSWRSDEWFQIAWDGRRWHSVDWTGMWADSVWDGRRWRASAWVSELWLAQLWDGRRWRTDAWTGRSWRDAAWDGRSWRIDAWNGRSWRDVAWDGRSWRDQSFTGRSWRVGDWEAFVFDGRSWRDQQWSQRAWTGTFSAMRT